MRWTKVGQQSTMWYEHGILGLGLEINETINSHSFVFIIPGLIEFNGVNVYEGHMSDARRDGAYQ